MERMNRMSHELGRPQVLDLRAALLDEYLALKEQLGPLKKRLEEVRDRLRDLVTEEGHFVDEMRALLVRVEPRFRKDYDAETLQTAFPRLSGCLRSSVDVTQLDACVRAGMITEGELERAGVLTRALHSRALVIKPLSRKVGQLPDVRAKASRACDSP